jgi:hypothetical protein
VIPKRRTVFRIAIASAAVAALLLAWTYYEWIGKYERNFKGMSESQAISILGKPWYDERRGHPEERDEHTAEVRDEYTLGWYFYVGAQLILKIQDGKVQNQWYGSK